MVEALCARFESTVRCGPGAARRRRRRRSDAAAQLPYAAAANDDATRDAFRRTQMERVRESLVDLSVHRIVAITQTLMKLLKSIQAKQNFALATSTGAHLAHFNESIAIVFQTMAACLDHFWSATGKQTLPAMDETLARDLFATAFQWLDSAKGSAAGPAPDADVATAAGRVMFFVSGTHFGLVFDQVLSLLKTMSADVHSGAADSADYSVSPLLVVEHLNLDRQRLCALLDGSFCASRRAVRRSELHDVRYVRGACRLTGAGSLPDDASIAQGKATGSCGGQYTLCHLELDRVVPTPVRGAMRKGQAAHAVGLCALSTVRTACGQRPASDSGCVLAGADHAAGPLSGRH